MQGLHSYIASSLCAILFINSFYLAVQLRITTRTVLATRLCFLLRDHSFAQEYVPNIDVL